MIHSEISSLPPTAIVLAGNWDKLDGPQPELSLETRMRVGAFAVYTEQAQQDVTAVFTGGLKAENGQTEVEGMYDFWIKTYPELQDKATLLLDGDCYDTATSARNTHALLEEQSLATKQQAFITSGTHLKRATRSFERNGFSGLLVPTSAEDLLLQSARQADQDAATNYNRSTRHHKRVIIEAGLRGLQRVDPADRMVGLLARVVRPNR